MTEALPPLDPATDVTRAVEATLFAAAAVIEAAPR